MDPRLADLHWADLRGDRPCGLAADAGLLALLVLKMAMGIDPLSHLRFDCRGEPLPSALTKDLRHSAPLVDGNETVLMVTACTVAYSLRESGLVTTKFKPKCAAFLNSSSTTFGYFSSRIAATLAGFFDRKD